MNAFSSLYECDKFLKQIREIKNNYSFMYLLILVCICPIPLLGQDVKKKAIFKRCLTGLNSQFSFS